MNSENLRKEIRNRDNYKCQLCFNDGKDVHHIDYCKTNSDKNNFGKIDFINFIIFDD